MYHMLRTFPISIYLLLCGLIMANTVVYRAVLAPNEIRVTHLSVAQGSATFVRDPHGKTVLIDAGADASILRALGNALPPWQRTIDAVVLTEVSTANAGGLPEVFSRYHVETFIRPPEQGSKHLEAALVAATSAENGLHQITLNHAVRLALGNRTYINLAASPRGVSISNEKMTLPIK